MLNLSSCHYYIAKLGNSCLWSCSFLFYFSGIDLIGILQKGIEASYLKTIRYETAPESESDIIPTDIPRPVSYI